MDYDAETQKWSVIITLGDGENEIQMGCSLDLINFGGLGALTQDGGNIKVSAGTYTIVLIQKLRMLQMTAN